MADQKMKSMNWPTKSEAFGSAMSRSVRPESNTLGAKSEHHNIVVTGTQWFDDKAGLGGGDTIDLVIRFARVNFFAACRSLATEFLPLAAGHSPFSFPKCL